MTERFWAKTGKGEMQDDGQPKYHPVICHLADTAAVAMEIVGEYLSESAIATLEKGLGLQGESLVKCCGFLAGCHDLGKVSPAFQFQVSEVGKALAGNNLYDLWNHLPSVDKNGKAPHGLVTAKTMPEFLLDAGLKEKLPGRAAGQLARKLAVIVGGHHGYFPSQEDIRILNDKLCGTNEGSEWQHQRFSQRIFEQLRGYVGLTVADLPTSCDNAAAMILAGLTTVSDWIASNPDDQAGFPYANDESFDEYGLKLKSKAQKALQAIGWIKTQKGQPMLFTELFQGITEPRELQKAAIALSENLTPPCFVLVEASMGEGKTEAALYLADYLQHQASSGGFYIGLPTQATSNAMWERVRAFLGQRYPLETINLTLSHSAAALKEDYQQCRLEQQVYDEDGKQKGQVGASEWHTARKRSMLSPYGVGTIDQGLMGAVRSKHQFVRLFGLAGRTVILDEIHAYDLYTSTLLERFLEWLAVLGSPVIALSATLPENTRKQLLAAYAKGCGYSEVKLPQAVYPRITSFSGGETHVRSFEASAHVRRSLNLHWVNDQEWEIALKEKLAEGGCAAVICSTVGRSQKVFNRLKTYFSDDELGLFHGRFLFCDRERIEKKCLGDFGKNSSNRPKRYVLVATQVIEQSLDVDFDLMISDIAPIDLLLQRSGRLHRHAERDNRRPTYLKEPTMWLIAPKFNDKGKANFQDSKWIYHRHILLRTWLILRDKAYVQLPKEMDGLIESIYNLQMEIPSQIEVIHQQDWKDSLQDYETGETRNKITKANEVKLPPANAKSHPSDFTRAGTEDDDNTIAKVTRLGDPTITTIFLQKAHQGLVLAGTDLLIDLKAIPDMPTIRNLLGHSTRIGTHGLVKALMSESKVPPTWTSALLKYCAYVELDAEGKVQVDEWQLSLDRKLGVVIEKL